VGTDKRERQKANRADRIAAAEDAARKAQTRSRVITYGILALVIAAAIVGVAWLTSDDDDDTAVDVADDAPVDPVETVPSETLPTVTIPAEPVEFVYGDGECPAEDGSSERTIDFDGPPPLCIDPGATHVAVFDTSEGEVRVDLNTAATPGTVNNFVTLARWGYYDDTVIFRTDPSIDIIQGGSPHTQNNTDPGPGYRITDEPTFATDAATGQPVGPYRYTPGQLVMARSSGPDSASAQFFFSTGPLTSGLDGQGVYVVFGDTDDAGLRVLQTIIEMHEDDPSNPLGGGPSETVTINSVTIEVS
jgi:cyclophilin family peptidyl-prolyl cis-trans isomerase